MWLIAAGLVLGLAAGIVGAVEFVTIGRAREHVDGWIHASATVMAVILALVNLLLRLGAPTLPGGLLAAGILLSLVTTALLMIAGWYGGDLAYRHMIGVTGHRS